MRKLKFQLDRKSLQVICISFTRPLLEYVDVVWYNCAQYEIYGKENNEAARIVTDASKLVSIDYILRETCLETLSSRRKKHKLYFLNYKLYDFITITLFKIKVNSFWYILNNVVKSICSHVSTLIKTT